MIEINDSRLHDMVCEIAGCVGNVYLDPATASVILCDGSDLILWRGAIKIEERNTRSSEQLHAEMLKAIEAPRESHEGR